MQQIRIQITGPGRGPGRPPGLLARILLSIVAIAALVVAAFLGAFFFLAALGLFFVAMVVLSIRVWWARRQFEWRVREGRRPGRDSFGRDRGPAEIEGEYRVLRPGEEGDRSGREPDGDR
jgi:membrane protein implicated in regulation of membrane protease activity